MIKVMFICHGNICRSPMAEYIFRHAVALRGLSDQILVDSTAVTNEEIGHDVYPPARRELAAHAIPCPSRAARRITEKDIAECDLLLCMDESNLRRLNGISPLAKEKARLLGEYALRGAEIEDPWYTGRFDRVYDQISLCCEALLDECEKRVRG